MKQSDQDKMDRYLMNKMSARERQAFEEALRTDPDLARQLAAHREAIALAKAMGDRTVKERIRQAGEKATEQIQRFGAKHKKNNGTTWLFLLLLAALAFALVYFFKKNKTVEPERIYASYYQALPLTFGDRGFEDLLSAASIAYGEKDYTKALQLFESAVPANEDAKVGLAKGICHMELQGYEEAGQILAGFIDDALYGEHCRWYLALCLLQTGDSAQAKTHLQYLAQSDKRFQHAAAKKILEQLN